MLISVINENGLRFNVRLVKKGERYGLVKDGAPCLVHKNKDPLVEFYDARYPIDGEIGQFVARYDRAMLTEDAEVLQKRGLCLHGGVPDWSIDGACMVMVLRALKKAAKCSDVDKRTGSACALKTGHNGDHTDEYGGQW